MLRNVFFIFFAKGANYKGNARQVRSKDHLPSRKNAMDYFDIDKLILDFFHSTKGLSLFTLQGISSQEPGSPE